MDGGKNERDLQQNKKKKLFTVRRLTNFKF